MLNKTLGSLHTVPAPSAAVLGESLKLLSTFGDKKDISKLLEQVLEVQTHNEQVFRDAQALMGELSAERKVLDDSRTAFAGVKVQEDVLMKNRAAMLSEAEARLSGRIMKFDQDQSMADKAISEKEKSLEERERAAGLIDLEHVKSMREMNLRLASLDKNEKELSARFAQLIEKERKLRAALDGG